MRVFLQPSAIHASKQPFLATTILGPCIAVCLWDQDHKFGGINHYMFPYWTGEGLSTPKFGNVAIKQLLNKMLSLGASKQNMIAKVFGGVNHSAASTIFTVGRQNAELALEILAKEEIRTEAVDVGGDLGRKVLFDSQTGKVKVKYISL